ncbi:PREDICTED: store-operated calcium entry-associated regulatory factor [Propithecus coquereli]|uniref:Store-operated calcium entry-associated regulatory factor n=1 Tax=Propithecus coquereli TaxID=379532 RepID=A0A2K6G4A7_PROCO|nr:PREDICTED: store-operated calcium entry-associated regulatory factor [Propithecus coquereli]
MAAAGGLGAAGRCPLLGLLLLSLIAGPALGRNDPDRILLRDVKALTLHYDRYTTSRRLDPIPQLKCVGGTAGCDSYTPKVIQCQNKGWDGYDVQWECKTDLDVAYKFGKTVVSCEGYESSEDQYGPQNTGRGATPGFGSAFTGQQGCENSGPGFWTGLGTGGILGYLFGSNRAATPFSDSWYYPSYSPPYSSTWNSRAYSPLRGGSGGYSANSNSDTKTRTASGYGGTRRR